MSEAEQVAEAIADQAVALARLAGWDRRKPAVSIAWGDRPVRLVHIALTDNPPDPACRVSCR